MHTLPAMRFHIWMRGRLDGEIAALIGCNRTTVLRLRRGSSGVTEPALQPSLALALRIQQISGGKVSVHDWQESNNQLRALREKARAAA